MVSMVPKYYMMDPDTEKLLSNGKLLRDGMKVLIESSNMRVDIDRKLQPWEMDRALKRNRWATISDVTWTTWTRDNAVIFIATYEDGSQSKETWGDSYAWLVKKDTIPSEDQEEKREKVQMYLMATIMDTMQMMMSEGLSDDEKTTQLADIVEKGASKILDLL